MRSASEEILDRFLSESNFASAGAIITDLDGTAVHEDQGRIYIPKSWRWASKSCTIWAGHSF